MCDASGLPLARDVVVELTNAGPVSLLDPRTIVYNFDAIEAVVLYPHVCCQLS